jgi:DHA3 family macrolide efflux protein-like MFS transporter
MQASTALMVPKEQLGRVNGLNQTLMGLMAIAAPSLGALLLKFFPIQGVMWIDVGTAAIAVAPLFFIAVPQPVKNAGQVGPEQKTSMWSDLREGLRYVGSWRGMLMIMVFAAILNFVLVPTFSLIALLVTQHFRGDVVQLGAINSAEGFGMLAGGLLLSAWGGFKKRIVTTMGGLLILGVAILTVGIAPANFFWLAVAGMALAGVATPIINGPLFAVVQTVVEPDKLGRVMSLLNATSSAMAPLSLAIAGPLSDLIGIRTWYIVGGITCLIMGFSGYFIKSIMTIEEQKHDTAQAIE